jgi:hypothetical protein
MPLSLYQCGETLVSCDRGTLYFFPPHQFLTEVILVCTDLKFVCPSESDMDEVDHVFFFPGVFSDDRVLMILNSFPEEKRNTKNVDLRHSYRTRRFGPSTRCPVR